MDPTPTASTFSTQLRGISPDFSEIKQGLEEYDLGYLTAETLIELLKRFLAIDPLEIVNADPEIVITGRRGRYRVKNSINKLTLTPVSDPLAAFVELSADEIPHWLDQPDPSVLQADPPDYSPDILLPRVSSSRRYLVAALMMISLGFLCATIYFSFQPTPINNEDDYRPIKNAQTIASLRKKVVGHYANVDGSVKIVVQDDRLVLRVSNGPNHSHTDESAYTYEFKTSKKGETVLFSREIGVIILTDRATLRYNGDSYRRTI